MARMTYTDSKGNWGLRGVDWKTIWAWVPSAPPGADGSARPG